MTDRCPVCSLAPCICGDKALDYIAELVVRATTLEAEKADLLARLRGVVKSLLHDLEGACTTISGSYTIDDYYRQCEKVKRDFPELAPPADAPCERCGGKHYIPVIDKRLKGVLAGYAETHPKEAGKIVKESVLYKPCPKCGGGVVE